MGFSIKSTFNLIQRKCKYTLSNANISSNAKLITAELYILRIIIQFNRQTGYIRNSTRDDVDDHIFILPDWHHPPL